MKEEYAIVLDYNPTEGVVYAVGTKFFTLLKLKPKPDAVIAPLEKVYVGPGKRDKIQYIIKRLKYDELTDFAKEQLEKAIEQIVKEREKEFVEFFNMAGPITLRLHSLELFEGIGKKTVNEIISEREREKFKSFEDIEKRIPKLKNIVKIIAKRILDELRCKDKYHLFTSRFC
ncbi:NEQ334 [Nanoarchaeum equitans Kin4-M]|uniref:NEQ334 n=1 Tax=Nanoarchaeum equitans (strain Kin4-M) TaxID=228908 RepID=Q74NI7_NANEQ|nr:NEQ334 [Nanoarchaeum equitans Kin4-M]